MKVSSAIEAMLIANICQTIEDLRSVMSRDATIRKVKTHSTSNKIGTRKTLRSPHVYKMT